MARMKWYDWMAYTLLVVGGLVHLGQAFGYYAVEELFSFAPILGNIVYGVVGLTSVYAIWTGIKLAFFK